MEFGKLLQIVNTLPIFETGLLLSGDVDPFDVRKQLSRWTSSGMWYLSDPNWPEPNLVLLSNALAQTNWAGPQPTPENWRELIFNRLKSLNWKAALMDVRPFLERPGEIDLLTLENMSRLLRQ